MAVIAALEASEPALQHRTLFRLQICGGCFQSELDRRMAEKRLEEGKE